jgi:hypothetical protein
MKKKIVADLTSLAHRILQLNGKEEVLELQGVAKELYEKLTVMVFTEKHFSDVKPTAENREIESKLEQAFEDARKDVETVSVDVEQVMEKAQDEVREAFANNDLSDLFVPEEKDTREEIQLPGISTIHKMVVEMPDEVPRIPKQENVNQVVKEEVKQVIEVKTDERRDSYSTTTNSLTDLVVQEEGGREEMDLPGIATIQKMVFEMPDEAPEVPKTEPAEMKTYAKKDLHQLTADFQTMPVFERKSASQESDRPKSLNSKLNIGLKIGMNDRMGFVKHLFNGNNQDFNRVISQFNTINSYEEAQNLINNMIKPDYNNWEGKESYENRFLELIARKYQ